MHTALPSSLQILAETLAPAPGPCPHPTSSQPAGRVALLHVLGSVGACSRAELGLGAQPPHEPQVWVGHTTEPTHANP